MIYFFGELFAKADGIKGSIVKPMGYSGWFAAIQLGWPQPARKVGDPAERYGAVWPPPDFQNRQCSLAAAVGAHSGKMQYYSGRNIRIKTIEIHFNQPKLRYSLRMLLEEVYVVGYAAKTGNFYSYEEWALDAEKGTASLLIGPMP